MGRSTVSRETGRARVAETRRGGDWVTLRDAGGRVQASYDPQRGLLCIIQRGETTIHDLCQYGTLPHCNTPQRVL